jgi:hypothetical protein
MRKQFQQGLSEDLETYVYPGSTEMPSSTRYPAENEARVATGADVEEALVTRS